MVVLLERIELSTSSLPMTRSTTELQQPDHFDALAITAAPGGFDRTAGLRPNGCDLVKRSCVFHEIMAIDPHAKTTAQIRKDAQGSRKSRTACRTAASQFKAAQGAGKTDGSRRRAALGVHDRPLRLDNFKIADRVDKFCSYRGHLVCRRVEPDIGQLGHIEQFVAAQEMHQ